MTDDTAFIVGKAMAIGLDLQERFPAGSSIHVEGENIAAACRNIMRALPFDLAKRGGPPDPARRRLRLVTQHAPIDDLDV